VGGLPNVGLAMPLGYGARPAELTDLAVAAERLGLDGIQTGESANVEAFSLLGAIASATSSIRLETAVVSVLSRSPALLGMAAATLADLSGGRFALGVGAGSPLVASWHGTAFPERPASALAEAVVQLRLVLSGHRLPDRGGFRLIGLPPRPDVRILMAAMNHRMLRAAGRIADGVVVNFADPEQVARMSRIARAARAEAGNGAPFEFVANLWAHAGGADAEERLRWEVAPYLAVPTYRAAAVAIAGAEAVDRAGAAWRDGGRAAAAPLVPQRLVDAVLVTGDAASFARRLAALRTAGADTVRLVPLISQDAGIAAAQDVIGVLGDVVQATGTPIG
jgi:alkanesulfonate monooxygenase SsuD/methylene tetrahydromethanopterin reductase-like flavin-dependent oxidoreductase (luciferase family)